MKLKILVLIVLLFTPAISQAETAGDFDGNGIINLEDVAYFMAWFIKGRTSDTTVVVNAAKQLYAPADGPIVRLPSLAKDSFAGGSSLNLNDIAIMMGYFVKGRSTDFSVVLSAAVSLYSEVSFVSKLPGTPLGSSSFSTTITGIEADP